jgi:putative molybdopterin biosynthesis protein
MGVPRNIYLKMKTLDEARRIVARHFRQRGTRTEEVPVPEAVGRVLAAPVFARLSSPNFHSAAMDGFAVLAANTFGVNEGHPRELGLGTEAYPVNTGHVLPPGTDAVIMIEHVQELDGGRIRIEAPAYPWQHVRRMGEDIVATELLFPRNHVLTAYGVGALLAGGVLAVQVRTRPHVLIVPTGSELVDWRTTALDQMRPGQVVESNAYMLGALVEAAGGRYTRHPLLPDDQGRIQAALKAGVGAYDAVMTVGGSSAGSEDFARAVVAELGEILIHGVAMMPGKPLLVGDVAGTPVFGMPGYPVSAVMAFEQIVRPFLYHLLEQPDREPARVTVETSRKIPSKLGLEEFLRVQLSQVGDRVVAAPLPRGAGSITTLTRADGIVRIPAHVEGIKDGAQVEAELLRPATSLARSLMMVGSHDNTLDILSDQLRAGDSGVQLVSSHVGSMGGLMAIRRGVCHLAGTHLLDTGDGSYNVSYVRRHLAGQDVRLVHLVMRDQGLIVRRGNPLSISGIADLTRPEVRFVNRQSGSGTRILLDYRLQTMGLEATAIQGYRDEEFTHMAVAVAVLSGRADAGLGIRAAARALELDFIPVVTEQYDVVIPGRFFDAEPIQWLLATIRSPEFQRRVEALGGYHTEHCGELIPL